MPPALITGMSPAGLHELASGGDGWGAPDVLQALLTIAGPRQPSPSAGGSAPAFTLKGTDGREITLASLAGKPAVINFWASYCPPCKAEMPLLQRLVGQRSDMQLVWLMRATAASCALLQADRIAQAAVPTSAWARLRASPARLYSCAPTARRRATPSSTRVLAAQLDS
jgi:hypothetical protein